MSTYDKAKALFDTFKSTLEADNCDLGKCDKMLAELKLLIFSGGLMMAPSTTSPDSLKELLLVRETLELSCFLSIRLHDLKGFERHVAQLKMYYMDHQNDLKPSEQKYPILGLYLLHLLASDRIGEFHTELELIAVDDHDNIYIKQPIKLESSLMEGNYAKVLQVQSDMPQMYSSFFRECLLETVRMKVGASLERSYENLPAQEAAKMLILADVPALKEFAVKENERKAREESDDPMGEMTPSLTRRAPIGLVKWEVKDGRLHFLRTVEKRLQIPALDTMVNTIGYATDLERIV